MQQDINTILEDFSFLTDWQEKYQYIIDLGTRLPPYPENCKNDAHKISGCISQVWLTYTKTTVNNENIFSFLIDSDSHMVKGLLAIVVSIYNGKTISEIKNIDIKDIFKQLQLSENITPQRSNGVISVIKNIHNIVGL
ncbi:SufE family protein [Bartonella sp. DGB1]|uniref:SufE family protein n=1 Tax=Bartonella sp. DGB1 TaxID=3239807 RepID=UPI0035253565